MFESRGSKIFLGIVIAIVIALALGFFFVTGSSTVPAQLRVESGNVMVNGESVIGNVHLGQGDMIETGVNGLAAVILYESVVINLEPDTRIKIDELIKSHPKVSQEKGETWNTFTELSGVEDYTIDTGNSIASVRATTFGIREGYVLGGEGETDYEFQAEIFLVAAGRVVEIAQGQATERAATQEELEKIRERMEKAIEELRHIRDLEINKKPVLYSLLKSRTGLTDQEIRQRLLDADEGLVDVDEFAEKSPIKVETIDKVVEITKAIQKIKADISRIQ
ncbi:MAG: hypothetical protein AABW93_02135 [Nanoarchaeota archaeon]